MAGAEPQENNLRDDDDGETSGGRKPVRVRCASKQRRRERVWLRKPKANADCALPFCLLLSPLSLLPSPASVLPSPFSLFPYPLSLLPSPTPFPYPNIVRQSAQQITVRSKIAKTNADIFYAERCIVCCLLCGENKMCGNGFADRLLR